MHCGTVGAICSLYGLQCGASLGYLQSTGSQELTEVCIYVLLAVHTDCNLVHP